MKEYLLICWAVLFHQVLCGPHENNLTKFLLNNTRYNSAIRPVRDYRTPTVVYHQLQITQILKLDEKNGVLTTNSWGNMRWKDEFLTWNPADFGNLTELYIDSSLVWTPVVIMYNNADDSLDETMDPHVHVDSNGTVAWTVPSILKTTCRIDVKYFPLDQQVCKLTFGSWSFGTDQIDIRLVQNHADLSQYQENGEWKMLGVQAKRKVVKHMCCTSEVSEVSYYLHVERRILYYMTQLILPCGLIAILTLLVFLTPPETGEQMAVGVTILLSLAVFFLMVEEKMPATSDSVPLIGKYYCVTILEISISLALMCWILWFEHHNPEPIPEWVKKYILGYMARLVYFDVCKSCCKKDEDSVEEEEEKRRNSTDLAIASTWMKKAGILNKEGEQKKQLAHHDPGPLKVLCDDILEEEKSDALKDEWKTAGKVLNRFCIGLYIFSFVVSVIGVFWLGGPPATINFDLD